MNWESATSKVLDLCKRALGRDATYLPAVGSPVSIRGVFGSTHVEVNVGQVAPMSSLAPSLGIKLSDLPLRPKKGDRVTVAGTTYRIIDSQEDGEGGALLILQRSA